jgi:hypothetical protein
LYLEITHIDKKGFVERMIELYLIQTGVDGSHVVGVWGLGCINGGATAHETFGQQVQQSDLF